MLTFSAWEIQHPQLVSRRKFSHLSIIVRTRLANAIDWVGQFSAILALACKRFCPIANLVRFNFGLGAAKRRERVPLPPTFFPCVKPFRPSAPWAAHSLLWLCVFRNVRSRWTLLLVRVILLHSSVEYMHDWWLLFSVLWHSNNGASLSSVCEFHTRQVLLAGIHREFSAAHRSQHPKTREILDAESPQPPIILSLKNVLVGLVFVQPNPTFN